MAQGNMVARVLDAMAAIIVLTFVGVIVVNLLFQNNVGSRERDGTSIESAINLHALKAAGRWIGPRTAPAVIVVYNDYKCGFCGELNTTLRFLQKRYPQHLAVVIKHFVVPSELTHYLVPLAADCAADQGVFGDYHEAAFAHSKVLAYNDAWRIIADSVELSDRAAFEKCVESRQHIETVIREYEEARRLGINSTPTLLIDHTMIAGAPPIEALDSLVARQFRNRSRVAND